MAGRDASIITTMMTTPMKWSNEQWAKALGVSRGTAYRWTKGIGIPGPGRKLMNMYKGGMLPIGICPRYGPKEIERIASVSRMNRTEMAEYLDITLDTLDNWRLGRRKIHPCAARLMYILEKENGDVTNERDYRKDSE